MTNSINIILVRRTCDRTAIEKRTTSLSSVWALLRKIYNKSAESFLDIGMITYSKSESYLSFFLYYIKNNLAEKDTMVDTVSTGEDGDTLTVFLMDMAALLWLEKLDRHSWSQPLRKRYQA